MTTEIQTKYGPDKARNKADVAEMRRRYMESEPDEKGGRAEAHRAYYLWLSDFLGLRDELIPATPAEVAASTDPHLNDIALVRWDNMHHAVDRIARYIVGVPWSLSDTVCCLKAMAKRRAGK
jgi:hypothetical protein